MRPALPPLSRRRLAVAASAAATTTALLGATRSARAGKADDTFTFALSGALDVLDPYYTGDREVTMIVGEMVFDTLVYRDPKSFEHRPLLATSWRSLDPLTIEFDLRPGLTWHDGKPFTADDVAYTFDYITDRANKVWAPEWSSWIAAAEPVGPLKVRVRSKEPFGPALEYFSQVLPILPRGFYGPGGTAGARHMVGTGPYRVTAFQPGQGASFVRNASYFQGGPKGSPAISKMAFRNIPDPATQIAELLSGGIDWIWRMTADQLERLATVPTLSVANGGTMRIFWLGFEGRKEPFQDVRVRRAAAHAINRKSLAEDLMGKSTPVLDVPCYPAQFGCVKPDAAPHYEYDPPKAKRLLAEAGFPNGFSTTMYIYRQSPDRMLAEAIQGFLRDVGIRADLRVTTLKAFYADMEQEKLPLGLQSYGQYGINDVSIVLPVYYAGGSRDSYRDPEVMQLIKSASIEADADKRRALFEQAGKRIVEQVLNVPLFIQTTNYVFSKELDFTAWPDENPRFYMCRWK